MSDSSSSVSAAAPSAALIPPPRRISGRWIVASMFAMGICATAFLYTYWTLHLMPFMPLQESLVREFPGSAPRVNGGQKKMHKQTPVVLQVMMKSPVDPWSKKTADQAAMVKIQQRVLELVREQNPLPGLQQLELHVYQLVAEDEIQGRSWRILMPAATAWEEVDDLGNALPADPIAKQP
ncbi:MAG: hypothetical protein ACKOEO_21040 [Planctomycetaceae bacterium]